MINVQVPISWHLWMEHDIGYYACSICRNCKINEVWFEQCHCKKNVEKAKPSRLSKLVRNIHQKCGKKSKNEINVLRTVYYCLSAITCTIRCRKPGIHFYMADTHLWHIHSFQLSTPVELCPWLQAIPCAKNVYAIQVQQRTDWEYFFCSVLLKSMWKVGRGRKKNMG